MDAGGFFSTGVDSSVTTLGVAPDSVTTDTYDVRVANLGSTSDIAVGELNANISGTL